MRELEFDCGIPSEQQLTFDSDLDDYYRGHDYDPDHTARSMGYYVETGMLKVVIQAGHCTMRKGRKYGITGFEFEQQRSDALPRALMVVDVS